MEATNQQNQQLQAQLSLLDVPKEGDGVHKMDSDEAHAELTHEWPNPGEVGLGLCLIQVPATRVHATLSLPPLPSHPFIFRREVSITPHPCFKRGHKQLQTPCHLGDG